ncbi:hypothetical protein EIP91_008965 [Steccherinum ochraceum]|uniref:DNA polymerase delta subunit 4 n=1 Tax=Steccherinum ochraceum TaxID=92696 RepID=A0A4V2MX77_9APHY|nr:hypothetical protein EIP91_008965 [Steccherinum ochraceum]
MAPPRASLSRKKSSDGLTQSKLSFKVGRGASTSKSEGKKLSRSTVSPATGSANSSSDNFDSKSSRGLRASTKRKRDADGASTSEDASQRGETPLDAEDVLPVPMVRPKLKVHDKKYSEQYVKIRRQMGNLEPIHADGLNKIHHILRMFDLSYEYGPCIGVTRLERWERANALGLNPPPEVKDILISQEGHDDVSYKQNVFHDYEV